MNPYFNDFPTLSEKQNGKRLVYLDNAATSQRPIQVLEAVDLYYREANANPHRGVFYQLSVKSEALQEEARQTVADFIHAKHTHEIIFTRGTTESLNLLAYSYAMEFLEKGDEIVLPVSEHHSNLVPWQRVAKAKGAILKYLYPDKITGQLSDEEIESKITNKTKIVTFAFVSNVLGVVNPIKKITQKAHSVGAIVILDCAQSIPHYPLDVLDLDVDFAAFSGHKMLAPMGIGVLYGKEALLEKMPPFLSGGDMIEYVHEQETTYGPLPKKFEAGTQNIGGIVGLAEAIRYIQNIGYKKIQTIENELTQFAIEEMKKLPYITIYGDAPNQEDRCGVISFAVQDVHPHDVSSILDADGIAIRAGHHCAQPLMEYLNVNATSRVSLYFYNTKEDIQAFLESLQKVRGWLGYGT